MAIYSQGSSEIIACRRRSTMMYYVIVKYIIHQVIVYHTPK